MSAITASQFESALPRILKAVSSSAFISLDCEFSGLNPSSSTRSCALDSLDARYAKIRTSTSAMGLLQFGICCFEHDVPNNRFIARPFSFHLWPRSSSGVGGPDADGDDDATFLSSASSLSFLGRNGFDLNSLVSNGISYMSREQERKLRNEKRIGIVRRFQKAKLEDEEMEMEVESGRAVRRKCKIIVTEGVPPPAAAAATSTPQDLANTTNTINNNNNTEDDAMTLWQTADILWYKETVAAIDAWVAAIDAWASASRWGNIGTDGDESMMSSSTHSSSSSYSSSFLTEEFIGELSSSTTSHNDVDTNPLRYPYILLPPCRSFHRRVIHVHLENVFGHGQSCPILTESRSSDQAGVSDFPYCKRMRLTWVGEPTPGKSRFHRLSLQRALREADVSVDRAIGFRKVIDAISTSGAPVVGHNCWMDLMHSHAKFIGPLPSNICDFALNLYSLFPVIYDTKHVVAEIAKTDAAAGAAFGYNTSLGLLYSTVSGVSSVRIPSSSTSSSTNMTNRSSSSSSSIMTVSSASSSITTTLKESNSLLNAAVTVAATSSTSSSEMSPPPPPPPSSSSSSASSSSVDDTTMSKPLPVVPPSTVAVAVAVAKPPFQRRSNYERAPLVEMESVEIDWKKYIGVELASGYTYATVGDSGDARSSSSSSSSSSTATSAAESGDVAVTDGSKQGIAHDAGFDAYMTGVVFARLNARIAAVLAEKMATSNTTSAAASSSSPSTADVKTTMTTTTTAVDDIEMASMRTKESSSSSSLSLPLLSPSPSSSSSSSSSMFSFLSLYSNILFNMRVMDWRLKAFNLSHAQSLARSNRQRVYAPESALHPEDAANTILLARASADRTKVLVVRGARQSPSSGMMLLHTDDIVQLILSGFPSSTPQSLFDPKKHVIWLDDYTAFVMLPSASCADAVLLAARGGGEGSVSSESGNASTHNNHSFRVSSSTGGVFGVISSIVNAVLGSDKITSTTTDATSNMVIGTPSSPSSPSSSSSSSSMARSSSNNSNTLSSSSSSTTTSTSLFDLSSLPISAFTPESLASLCPPSPTLQTIGLQSYKEYLIEHKDLYGDECDHEIVATRFDFTKKREGSNIEEINKTEVKKKPS